MPGFTGAPGYNPNHAEMLRKLNSNIEGIMQGKTNNTGTFTLNANTTTTTITFADGRLGQDTVMTWMPTTANAAGALSGMYVSSRSVANRTLTITHANTAAVDKTFSYVLTG
jgi:hypothetical protein